MSPGANRPNATRIESVTPGSRPGVLLTASLVLVVQGLLARSVRAAEKPDGDRPEPPKLELGAGAGIAERTSKQRNVSYAPGLVWSGHATVVVLPYLGFRISGGMEYHAVHLDPGALGVAGDNETTPTIRGPHVVAQLQPMIRLMPSWEAFALAGIAWQRFTASTISVGEPSPLLVSSRSGVVVELPFGIGTRYAFIPERMALSLLLSMSTPISDSGDLFNSRAGTSQSLRQDTGELVRVAALPSFGTTFGVGASVDYFF